MSLKYWKEILIVLMTSGFIGQVIGVWDVSTKREDSYIVKYIGCQQEVIDLNRKVDLITNRLNTLELASAEIPFPYWIKDRNSVILYVNKEYEKRILKPLGISKAQMINTRGEVMGVDFVNDITHNDNIVMRSTHTLEFRENIPSLGMGTSYKFATINNFGIVIGSAGIWIPDDKKLISK